MMMRFFSCGFCEQLECGSASSTLSFEDTWNWNGKIIIECLPMLTFTARKTKLYKTIQLQFRKDLKKLQKNDFEKNNLKTRETWKLWKHKLVHQKKWKMYFFDGWLKKRMNWWSKGERQISKKYSNVFRTLSTVSKIWPYAFRIIVIESFNTLPKPNSKSPRTQMQNCPNCG